MTINVTRSSMPPFEEYCEEIRELWDSHWLTNMGSKHQQLERELKQFLGCGELALFTNGHLALENVIEAFGLHGEIITTPFTFASTTHAIVRCGSMERSSLFRAAAAKYSPAGRSKRPRTKPIRSLDSSAGSVFSGASV